MFQHNREEFGDGDFLFQHGHTTEDEEVHGEGLVWRNLTGRYSPDLNLMEHL